MAQDILDIGGDIMPHLPAAGGGGGGAVNSVTAGAGLTNSGTAADPDLNVGEGVGISVSADAIAIDVSDALAWTAAHTWTAATVPITGTITDASAATQIEAARFRHLSSISGTAGNGAYVSFWATNTTPAIAEAGRIIGGLRTVVAGTENGALIFQHAVSGAMANCGHTANAGIYGASNLSIGTISATLVTTTLAQWSIASTMVNHASSSASNGGHSFTGTTNTSGARAFFVITPSSNTGSTAGTEVQFFSYQTHTHQFASNTAVASQREFCIAAPTYAFASATGTISDAATLYISGAPIAGTNAVITRGYSIWTDAGDVRHDGIGIALGGGSAATLGTIGGSGPATAGQNQWARLNIDGTTYFIPVWV